MSIKRRIKELKKEPVTMDKYARKKIDSLTELCLILQDYRADVCLITKLISETRNNEILHIPNWNMLSISQLRVSEEYSGLLEELKQELNILCISLCGSGIMGSQKKHI